MNRRKAREYAFILLFQYRFQPNDMEEILADFFAQYDAGEQAGYIRDVVEGTVREIFKEMKHPYTIGLFQSIPSLKEDVKRLKPIDGLMPDPMKLPPGCCFSTRCPYAEEKCRQIHPELVQAEGSDTHRIRCLKWKNIAQ